MDFLFLRSNSEIDYLENGNRWARVVDRIVGEVLMCVVGTKGLDLAMDVLGSLAKISKFINSLVNKNGKVVLGLVEGVAETIARKSVRLLDEVANVALSSRVKKLRALLTSDYKKIGNFGYSKANIEGVSKSEYYAHRDLN